VKKIARFSPNMASGQSGSYRAVEYRCRVVRTRCCPPPVPGVRKTVRIPQNTNNGLATTLYIPYCPKFHTVKVRTLSRETQFRLHKKTPPCGPQTVIWEASISGNQWYGRLRYLGLDNQEWVKNQHF
jgi:hypothetical protein